jgi:uncharacterized membrane protein (UPF0127 family)
MLRASACHNYSPKPADDATVGPEAPIQGLIMAESQRIQRETRGIQGDPEGLLPVAIPSATRPGVLQVGDARGGRALDAAANFAAMATFTTQETSEPVPLELAESARARRRGLLGRDGIEGALLLSPANAVHTLGMRFAVDVAYLDRQLRVLAVRTMRPGRVGLPRPRARHVLEAEAGAMRRWGVRRGVRVTVRDA